MNASCNSTYYRKANKLSEFRRMKYVLNQFALRHKKRGFLLLLICHLRSWETYCNQISNAETHAVYKTCTFKEYAGNEYTTWASTTTCFWFTTIWRFSGFKWSKTSVSKRHKYVLLFYVRKWRKKVKIPLTPQRYNKNLKYANNLGKNMQNVRKNLHICKKSSTFAACFVHK